MKGRKFSDQIFLSLELVEYAEEELQNGAIVALDQKRPTKKHVAGTYGRS
jgi:hypothetical protein